jgi:hypothetical protein
MELFLNLLWLLIALTGLAFWRLVWARQPRLAPRAPLRECTAFVYAAVLLFFPISLSDDLHSDLLLFDICSSGRRQSIAPLHSGASHQTENSASSPQAAIPGPFAALELPCNPATAPLVVESRPRLACATRRPSGRAPPAASISA